MKIKIECSLFKFDLTTIDVINHIKQWKPIHRLHEWWLDRRIKFTTFDRIKGCKTSLIKEKSYGNPILVEMRRYEKKNRKLVGQFVLPDKDVPHKLNII